ncbi:HAMP domain-containing histidine kinase [Hoeflea sp. WL0058]|uniref:histidine kinase n=1 Tax=Flavimaribacter sediminis TaxID=2865987 RepID=A0AAE3D1B0_9HYPH|nr:ATP-binding protein [Flavimaribacter sediminis]MBW8639485.1 HAMP domain-containing histidine kinase [Flavimaribacter sediminis]
MSRLGMVLRTTAVRLSALYFTLFLICALVLVFYISGLTSRIMIDQTQEVVHEELELLGRAYRTGGVTLLISYIDRRSRQPGANLYLIAAPNGQVIAGNVESIQGGVLDKQGWTETPFTYGRFTQTPETPIHTALAEVILLPNGMRLLVGRDLREPTQFRTLVRGSLALALGMMVAGALVIWLFLGRRALRRIERMSRASEKILAGDLSQRLPIQGSNDEFDRLSESLNAIMARIESLNEGLRQVSDNIAHDLKTPLTRLRNRAEAAMASGEDIEDFRTALEQMVEESDQLIRTFNALLMISRVEAGSSAAEIGRLDLSQIARDVAELYEPVAEEAGVALTVEIEDGVEIEGNRELIGQGLSNLVDNAIKYSAVRKPDARVAISLETAEDAVVVTVADNGSGIPEEDRAEVVKRFVRLDKSRNLAGNGLGLSLVEAIMSLHRGRLEFGAADPDDEQWPGLRARMIFRR